MPVQTLIPTANDTLFNAWLLGAGASKFSACQTNDGDTSYITTSFINDRQGFSMSLLSEAAESIISVTVHSIARETAGDALYRAYSNIAAVTADYTINTLVAAYTLFSNVAVARPTGGPWVPNDFLTGTLVRFGVQKTGGGGNSRVTLLNVDIDYIQETGGFAYLAWCWIPPLLAAASHGLQPAEAMHVLSSQKIRPSGRGELSKLMEEFKRRPAFAF